MLAELVSIVTGKGAIRAAHHVGVLDCPRSWEPYIWAVETGRMSPATAVQMAGADRYAFVEAQGRLGPQHKFINGRFVEVSYWKRRCR